MATNLRQGVKAIYAASVAGLAALGGLLVNDTSLSAVTAGQWVFVLLATLVAGGGVYGLRNAPTA